MGDAPPAAVMTADERVVMTADETVVGKAVDERGCCCDAGRW